MRTRTCAAAGLVLAAAVASSWRCRAPRAPRPRRTRRRRLFDAEHGRRDRPDPAAGLDRSAGSRTGRVPVRAPSRSRTTGRRRGRALRRRSTSGSGSRAGYGSFRPLTEKAAFKLKFDEYVDGQNFLGLQEADPQQHGPGPLDDPRGPGLRGVSRGRRARRRGPATPSSASTERTSALYLNVETLDKVVAAALVRLRPSISTRASTAIDVMPGGAGAFEVDEGNEDDRGDLEALIAAANGDGRRLVATGRGRRRPRRDDRGCGRSRSTSATGTATPASEADRRCPTTTTCTATPRAVPDAALGHRPDLGSAPRRSTATAACCSTAASPTTAARRSTASAGRARARRPIARPRLRRAAEIVGRCSGPGRRSTRGASRPMPRRRSRRSPERPRLRRRPTRGRRRLARRAAGPRRRPGLDPAALRRTPQLAQASPPRSAAIPAAAPRKRGVGTRMPEKGPLGARRLDATAAARGEARAALRPTVRAGSPPRVWAERDRSAAPGPWRALRTLAGGAAGGSAAVHCDLTPSVGARVAGTASLGRHAADADAGAADDLVHPAPARAGQIGRRSTVHRAARRRSVRSARSLRSHHADRRRAAARGGAGRRRRCDRGDEWAELTTLRSAASTLGRDHGSQSSDPALHGTAMLASGEASGCLSHGSAAVLWGFLKPLHGAVHRATQRRAPNRPGLRRAGDRPGSLVPRLVRTLAT